MISLTILGYILIPLTIYLLIKGSEKIFYLMVFFSPFTASAILNIDAGPLKYGLQVSYWFGAIWILLMLFKIIKGEIGLNRLARKISILIGAFWTIGLISLSMPFILSKLGLEIKVISIKSWVGNVPLRFSTYNITQFMYFSFVLILLQLMIVYYDSRKKIINTIKTLLISTQVTVIWGFVQLFTAYTKIQYPYYIFNNTIGLNHWDQIEGSIKRVNSVAAEPSMYSLFLVMMIPLIVFIWINNLEILSKKFLNILTGSTVVMLLLTTSTTAYLGITVNVLCFAVLFVYGVRNNIINPNVKKNIYVLLYGVLILIVLAGLVFIIFPSSREFFVLVKNMIFKKLSSGSGMERKSGFLYGLEIFSKSPLLGVGIGSNRTYDLFTTLLSTTGILGFVAFSALVLYILKQGFKTILSSNSYEFKIITIGLVISIVSGITCMFISVPDMIFIFFWINLALIFVINRIEKIK